MARQDTDENPLTQEEAALEESVAIEDIDSANEAEPKEVEDALIEKGADANVVEPAELEAMHTDNESAQEASGKGKKAKKTEVKKEVVKKTLRSAKYQENAGKVDVNRSYGLEDALELAKETSYAKFDGSIEMHIRLLAKKGKGSAEHYRTITSLPHGTGKEPKIAILDEAMIDEIKQKGDTSYDILIATPALMPKVAQVAKVLGPKGKMPNPKTGTVSEDPEAAKRAILSGRVELRADAYEIVHQIIGRVSWPTEKLVENARALLAALPTHKILSVKIASTMGPGVSVKITD